MIDVQKLENDYAKDIERLNQMSRNILTMNAVEYAYTRLMALKFEATMEFFLEVEALTTGLVVSYGRMFTGSDGTTKLKESKIPGDLRATHKELMELRHKRHAHHGAHPLMSSKVTLIPESNGVVLNHQMQIGFWVGAAKHWGPFFEWLRGFIYEMINDLLRHISEKSGVTWRMAQGPAPDWTVSR